MYDATEETLRDVSCKYLTVEDGTCYKAEQDTLKHEVLDSVMLSKVMENHFVRAKKNAEAKDWYPKVSSDVLEDLLQSK